MLGTAKHFALAAATSAGVGLALEITRHAATYSGAEAPSLPFDPVHLLTVGPVLFLIGAVLVQQTPSLLPDPKLRHGVAPRAFWVTAVAVFVRAWAGPAASPKEPFFSALALGGAFLELAALGLILVPILRPPAPAASLTPPEPSGTETGSSEAKGS